MGTVLSSFFWGYSLTQVLGGYLSDRFGAERVLLASGLGWGLITFWFHQIVKAVSDHDKALTIIVFARVLLGAFQVRPITKLWSYDITLALFYSCAMKFFAMY